MAQPLHVIKHYAVQQLQKIYRHPEQAQYIFWELMAWITQASKSNLMINLDRLITHTQKQQLQAALREHIIHHKPIQYIIGSVDFLDLSLSVRPPILIPRPETEYWTQLLINQLRHYQNKVEYTKPFQILDLCTGSGCIGLSVAYSMIKSQVNLVDIQPEAIALAQENLIRYTLPNARIFTSNLFEQIPPANQYAVITANPPYICYKDWLKLDASVKQWEDKQALLAQENGLALIATIIEQAPKWLTQQSNIPSQLWLELDPWQITQATKLLSQRGFYSITIHKDQYQQNRVIQAIWKNIRS